MPPLIQDEFRLLAFMRGYADRCEQHFDPGWLQRFLELSEARMHKAARGLAAKGLVAVFEWQPSKGQLFANPELGEGPRMRDIGLTEYSWNYLRPPEV